MAKALGPMFGREVEAAGLSGLPFTWGNDGTISGRERLSTVQQQLLDSLVAAHDPTKSFVPNQTDLWRARLVMKATPWTGTFGGAGKSVFDAVKAAIQALPAAQQVRASEAIEYSNVLTRSGNLVRAIQQQLGMTDDQIDDLFRQADAIQP
jgi:hypothetical protein